MQELHESANLRRSEEKAEEATHIPVVELEAVELDSEVVLRGNGADARVTFEVEEVVFSEVVFSEVLFKLERVDAAPRTSERKGETWKQNFSLDIFGIGNWIKSVMK